MSYLTEFGKRIKHRRLELDMTQEELARQVGYTSRSSINKIELGLVDLPQSKISAIANALGVSPAYLLGWETDGSSASLSHLIRPLSKKSFPLLGNVACGEPIFADEDHESFIEADSDIDADFCLTAHGDSMINARIFDGDILFVKKQNFVADGEIAVVLIDDEATVKRIYFDKESETLTLAPENPTIRMRTLRGAELNSVRILGKVVAGQYVIK